MKNAKSVRKNEDRRIEYIDTIRGIILVLVMYGHSGCFIIPKVSTIYYSFYMSSFFVFSGYFYSKKSSSREYIIKKIKTLYVPYVIWFIGMTIFIFGWAIDYTYYSSSDSLVTILMKGMVGVELPNYAAQYWFLMSFLTMHIIYSLIDGLVNSIEKKSVIIILLTICGILLNYCGFRNTPFRVDTALMMIPMFCFGIILRRNNGLIDLDLFSAFIISGLYVTSSYCNYYFYHQNISLSGETYNNYCLFYYNAILGTIIIMNIFKRIDSFKEKSNFWILRLFNYFGRNSMTILLDMNFCIVIIKKVVLQNIAFLSSHQIVINYLALLLTCILQFPIIKLFNQKRIGFLVGR